MEFVWNLVLGICNFILIGINAFAAFRQPRTGVEEYTYQVIKHLAMLKEAERHRFRLYASKQQTANNKQQFLNFGLPKNFEIKGLRWSLSMWTQVRLAAEILFHEPDVLFIPVHILPLTHPKNSVVTIHGLEYEYYPEMYPSRHLRYLRWSTKYALRQARKIIAVSENTKKDLVELYGGNPEKIEVVYHGVHVGNRISHIDVGNRISHIRPYILFIGRLEKKKNIDGLIRAFHLLKQKYKIPHKLVLAGAKGYEGQSSQRTVPQGLSLIFTGYISEQEKWSLLKNAEVFVFPSFYEGFGLPILEAQAAGLPVITSNVSSMPEVAGDGAILIDPKNIESIASGIYKVISDKNLKKELIGKGYENVKRFSWQKCAEKTLKILSE